MKTATVLYDADCGFCRWALARILQWDHRGRLRPIALQDRRVEVLLPGMTAEDRGRSWHLVTATGEVYSGGAVLPPLLGMLRWGAWLGRVLGAFPRSTDRLYRWVADHRDIMGRVVGARACSIDPRSMRSTESGQGGPVS